MSDFHGPLYPFIPLLFLGLTAGCRPPAPADGPTRPSWFRDVTAASGIDFRHDAGPPPAAGGPYPLPQVIGSGAALFDFDGDGHLDLYLVHNGGPGGATNRLYRNRGDGTFVDVSRGCGLDVAGHGMGVAAGDVDNDGRVDVYLSQYGGGRLFHNEGGTFADVTRSAGVEQPRWGTSAAFFDYDRDGWLDLVVVNYVDYDPGRRCAGAGGRPDYCHPGQFFGTAARLFHNRGRDADGRWLGFEDVTTASGLAALPGPGLGVICADFDGDGWPDVFVANDAQPNRLWINRHDGTFTDEALARGIAVNAMGNPQANMGVAVGDVDGDGRLDLVSTHLTEETHTLWLQTERGLFRDRTAAAGLAAPRWRGTGFGTVLADFDHDGRPDLAVVNGRVSRGPPAATAGPGRYWQCYAERNQLFAGADGLRFDDISECERDLCGTAAVSRGLAWGDVDGDGAPDLVVTAVAGPARLYRNVAPKRGHWLMVGATDPELRRDAYGARVTVVAGRRRWVGLINPGQSYLCSGDPRVHFGLGAVDRVDEVRVDWPRGRAEVFDCPGVDRVLSLVRGRGRKVAP